MRTCAFILRHPHVEVTTSCSLAPCSPSSRQRPPPRRGRPSDAERVASYFAHGVG